MQALSLAAYDIQLAGRFADAVGGAPDQSALICSVLNEEPELQGGRSAVDRQDRAHASPISFLLHVDSILIRLRRDQSEVDAHWALSSLEHTQRCLISRVHPEGLRYTMQRSRFGVV